MFYSGYSTQTRPNEKSIFRVLYTGPNICLPVDLPELYSETSGKVGDQMEDRWEMPKFPT